MDGESRSRGNEEMKQRREAETEDERRTTVGKVKAARIGSFTFLSLFSSGLQAAYIQQVEGGKRRDGTSSSQLDIRTSVPSNGWNNMAASDSVD